ncbi:MAG: glycosyl hydrolase [Flavobacteriia bacterium]|nr:glycosyl hydrolase [Flavobacteriia bacterium]
MKNHILLFFFFFQLIVFSQKKETSIEKAKSLSEFTNEIQFRNIGPALTSGRIVDIAVHSSNKDLWYIASASGGLWKTQNHGTTFTPIFDQYTSYSTACIEITPSNPNILWLGTGENNNQRSVSYGDGVYKSTDGGKSFQNMGLKNSEHIGSIVIHPNNEQIVWVAAYGPLWSAGGDRGIYKTIDGGKNWEKVLYVSEHTGFNEIHIDPNNPDILYATSHQRRRHEYTYIGGGPESSIYKSIDGGKSWYEIIKGLPKNEMGRIGLSVSPSNPNYLYAIVEARYEKGGIFKSTDKGESWEKQSNYTTSGNYYQELFCDPLNKDKIFIMDTYLQHSLDGGKNVIHTPEENKHVDNHAIWIDPSNTDHYLVGCDGGLYETFTNAQEWKYYENLPLIQFYKVACDNSTPFYNVYGGTQDNNSMGGPSATLNNAGILNSDWFITNGGDGFESAIDPLEPNIVYAQAQYGWLVRYDKKSGEKMYIQPLPKIGEPAYRWNWDSPLFISPHDHKTLYFAANKVFKSTNRGDDWEIISPDLSQGIDRNQLPVMGQVWSVDAIMKNASTTIYGNIVSLDESPLQKGLLYAGTDDGAIQISENDGQSWRKMNLFSGVPQNSRINMLLASLHDENEVFACIHNQRNGDFKPYLLKSNDKGKTWKNIQSNLPERGSVYCIRQDFIDKNLLFVGTEFGAYFSNDGGNSWNKLSGLPTIAIYDLEIQKRETDLVCASFGRGFYVLDNYSPLRELQKEVLDKKAHLFPVKDALLYVPTSPLGDAAVGSHGANLWTAPNPQFGATFTFFLKDDYKTKKEIRRETELLLEKEKKPVPFPTFEELTNEELEEETKILFIIKNSKNDEVKRILKKASKGVHRVYWNLRNESTKPLSKTRGESKNDTEGFLVSPGKYSVEIFTIKNGKSEKLVDKTYFNINSLNNQTIRVENVEELSEIRNEVLNLNRKVYGSSKILEESFEQLYLIKQGVKIYPNSDIVLLEEIRQIELDFQKCNILLNGDKLKAKLEMEFIPSIIDRLSIVEYSLYETNFNPTKSQYQNLSFVKEEYTEFRKLLDLNLQKLKLIEEKCDALQIPYTKGKGKDWKKE